MKILSFIFASLGIPVAGLTFIGSGMKTVPELTLSELVGGISLVSLSVVLGIVSVIGTIRKTERPSTGLLSVLIVSVLTIAVLVSTYLGQG